MCDPQKLTGLYLDVCENVLGLQATATVGGDVEVTSDDGWHFTIYNHAPLDPEYLQLVAAFRSKSDPAALPAACAVVNSLVNGVKVVALPESRVVCSVEFVVAATSCLPSRELLAAVLPRAIRMLGCGLGELQAELEKSAAGTAA